MVPNFSRTHGRWSETRTGCSIVLHSPRCFWNQRRFYYLVEGKTLMDRRRFLQSAAGVAIAATTSPDQVIAAPLKSSKVIGIQIGAVSFADEGVEKVLDECERAAAVNTLF